MKAVLVISWDGKEFGLDYKFDSEGSNDGYGCAATQHISNVARSSAIQGIEYLNKGKLVFCPPADIQKQMQEKANEGKKGNIKLAKDQN